ncbi:hypothetical protein M5689_017162 [Euphorbia peplus]|nr:hypothetical protein M5689_017162 [Euphorbia peplus]
MAFLLHRGVFLLLLLSLAYLSLQPQQVCALKSIDLALRFKQQVSPFTRHSRILETLSIKDLPGAPSPSVVFDPNQSNKRTVRKGSDPIHNRC